MPVGESWQPASHTNPKRQQGPPQRIQYTHFKKIAGNEREWTLALADASG